MCPPRTPYQLRAINNARAAQQNEKELRIINIVHPFRGGGNTLRLTNNKIFSVPRSSSLPVCRGDDDDDVVVTDAPPIYPPNPNKRDLLLKVVRKEQKRKNTPPSSYAQSARLRYPKRRHEENGSSGWMEEKQGRRWGRDATHHGRSVAKSPGHDGAGGLDLSLQNDALAVSLLSIDPYRAGRGDTYYRRPH